MYFGAIRCGPNRAQNTSRRTLAANTAEEIQLDSKYLCFLLVADASNAGDVYFILHEASGGADPTMLSGDGDNGSHFLLPGMWTVIVLTYEERGSYLRVKSPGIANIRLLPFDPANPLGAML